MLAPTHPGLVHDAGIYGSDEELLDLALPVLRGGQQAGEPTMVCVDPRLEALVRSALPNLDGLTFLSPAQSYVRPATTIKTFRSLLDEMVVGGAEHIRIVGQIPLAAAPHTWQGWARYEAAVEVAYAGYPLLSLCLYDSRATPAEVLDDVVSTHPSLASTDGASRVNPAFQEPTAFLRGLPRPAPDPLQAHEPDVVLRGPNAREARQAAAAVAVTAGLADADATNLLLAISELTSNAHLHGSLPVTVSLWARPGRVVAAVSDLGSGPRDPFVGLVPLERAGGEGGRGLWIVHQVCTDVSIDLRDEGCTIRIAVGQQS